MSIVISSGDGHKEYVLSEIGSTGANGGRVATDLAYEETNTVNVLPECRPTYDESEGAFFIEAVASVEVGKTYTVNWNGADYDCVAIDGGQMGTILGDISAIGGEGGNGEPFLACVGPGLVIVLPLDGTTEPTISIKQEQTVVKTVDPKFLPQGVPYVEDNAWLEIPYSYEWNDTTGDGIKNECAITIPIGLEVGKSYIVNWNNVDYEVTSWDASNEFEGLPAVGLGDPYFVTSPFTIIEFGEELAATSGVYGVAIGVDCDVPFSIKQNGTVISKLDNRCLDLAWLPTMYTVTWFEEIQVASGDSVSGQLNWDNFHVGAEAVVVMDGVSYKVTSKNVGSGPDGLYYAGNVGLITSLLENTGEPFVVSLFQNSSTWTFADGGTHAIEICEEVPNKIPVEFLPIDFLPDDVVGIEGVGIASIKRTSGNGSAGTTDVYTVTLTDGRTSEFTVYNGKDGVIGKDGATPHIGDNGNWFIGDTDTGVKAEGKDGAGGGGGVSSWNDLTDKPFCEGATELVEVLAETTVTESEEEPGAFYLTENVPTLLPDEIYIVNWQGTEYRVKSMDMSAAFGTPAVMLVNDGVNLDTGEGTVFVVVHADFGEGIMLMMMDGTGANEVTLSIKHEYTEIKTIDPKFLPQGTPYIQKSYGVLLEETEFTAGEDGPGKFYIADLIEGVFDGETYIVTYNGTAYTCIAQFMNLYGLEGHALGNVSLVTGEGESTGEPFALLIALPEYVPMIGLGGMLVDFSGATSATVSLEGNIVKVRKLDQNLLPRSVATTEYADEAARQAVDNIVFPTVTVDTNLSLSSTNPVQNKAVYAAISNKVDKVSGKGLSANDFSAYYKEKLDGIQAGATKVIVDSELSNTSLNTIQNKAVTVALSTKPGVVTGGTTDTTRTGESKYCYSGAEMFNYVSSSIRNYAFGKSSHAEGSSTTASGDQSHSEGDTTTASGKAAHAEGINNTASGEGSHTEGMYTTASGQAAHTEGMHAIASGVAAHAEGYEVYALGDYSHAEGYYVTALGSYSHAEGKSRVKVPDAITSSSTNEEIQEAWSKGSFTLAKGQNSHVEGLNNLALGDSSHAEGQYVTASGQYTHAEGMYTTASGQAAHAEGNRTKATGVAAHAEGNYTTSSGMYSHTEGMYATASGQAAHAEGLDTAAWGTGSHAEGRGAASVPNTVTESSTNEEVISEWNNSHFTLAKGQTAHAEGRSTLALGDMSHAECDMTIASGIGSHAEGSNTTASGPAAHAEGSYTTSSGMYSHAEGQGTIASGTNQHVQGSFNIEDTEGKYSHIVGNGASDTTRSNSHTLDRSGNAWFAGDVYVGGTGPDDPNAKKLSAGGGGDTGTVLGTIAFTVTLPASDWVNDTLTVTSDHFVASDYAYLVTPTPASYIKYMASEVYAIDVMKDGEMTFHCAADPKADLVVNVLRMDVVV